MENYCIFFVVPALQSLTSGNPFSFSYSIKGIKAEFLLKYLILGLPFLSLPLWWIGMTNRDYSHVFPGQKRSFYMLVSPSDWWLDDLSWSVPLVKCYQLLYKCREMIWIIQILEGMRVFEWIVLLQLEA